MGNSEERRTLHPSFFSYYIANIAVIQNWREYVMKVIFLDVDGVLNSAKDHYTTNLTNPSSQHRLNLLYSSIINSGNTEDDVQICISSSWRVPTRLKNHLIDQLNKHNMEVCGCTEYDNKTRGQQISDYLNNNADKNITGYVVIDDETIYRLKES